MAEIHTDASPSAGTADGLRKRATLVFVVSEDWYFVSHRLPMARAARDAGLRVVVATRFGDCRAAIEAEGFEAVALPFDRGATSVLQELRCVAALVKLFRRLRPDIVHCVAIKPIVDGSLAAFAVPKSALICSFAGMGSVLGEHARATPLRRILMGLLRLNAGRRNAVAVVQNGDDRDFLLRHGLAHAERLVLIPGSGVDLKRFAPSPEPAGPTTVLMVARLLRDKGVEDLVAAARLLDARGQRLRIRIAGSRDPANPASVGETDLAAWQAEGLVEFLGRRDDVDRLLAEAHIAVLPSYREGLPKSLLEAAACGRPLVTTDVPGCRELVPDESTGLLVPPGNAVALADALQTLAADPAARAAKGMAARRLVEARFSDAVVAERTAALYRSVMVRR